MRGLADQADNFVGMELNDPTIDFVGLARSLGCASVRVERPHDLAPALSEALQSPLPYLVDVAVERG
jgi:benzoylformate decarboxylase